MITISHKDLIEKLKVGDLIYVEYGKDYKEHDGWKIYNGNGFASINSTLNGSWSSMIDSTIKNCESMIYVPIKEIHCYNLSMFFHTFDIRYLEENDMIYNVIIKSDKEIEVEKLIEKLSSQLEDAKKQLERIRGK